MSYYKDKDYGRSGRSNDGDYRRSGRSRDDEYGRSGRSRDDEYGRSAGHPRDDKHGRSRRHRDEEHGRSRRSRDDEHGRSGRSLEDEYGRRGRSHDKERYSSNLRRELRTYSHSHGMGDLRDGDDSKDQPTLIIHRDNLFHDYIEQRVMLEVQARHKKTHAYIGKFMAFDLTTNVVLADCYRLHEIGAREPLREDVQGLLVVRGSRVLNVRRAGREAPLKGWPPEAGKKKKKRAAAERRRRSAESRATAAAAAALTQTPTPKSAPARPLKLKRSWKPEGGVLSPAKSESAAMADKISQLRIKEEPAEADVEAVAKREVGERGGGSSDPDVAVAKREPRGDSEDGVEEAAKRFVKQEITLEEFLNASCHLDSGEGESSD